MKMPHIFSNYAKESKKKEVTTNPDTRTCVSIINQGEHDELTISGYRRSLIRSTCCWLCIILTCGLLRLILHWKQRWLLFATYQLCPLDVAEKILIEENYNRAHTSYYIKDVITINDAVLSNLREDKKKWESYFPRAKPEDKMAQRFHLSVHFSSGHFKHFESVRLFRCKQLRYIWDEQTQTFHKLKGLDMNVPARYLHQRKGLSCSEEYARRLVYGPNEITIPFKNIPTLLFLEVLNPYYVFQVFSVILWMCYSYYYYAVVIVIMSIFGITMSIIQTRKNQNALRDTVVNSDFAFVIHDDGSVEQMETHFLVPGDIIEIPANGCTMQCDAVLLSGNCILDEAILTGESVPVTKTPLPLKQGLMFDAKEHSRHTLFCGTKVIQTRYIGTEKVLAVVINTGNITAKGGLIRSILYPPPVDYKFERDSYKFITLLACIAAISFLYTLVTKIMRGIPATKIAIEALDLITIAVPPALPAAMSVGRFYALKRLKKQNIYCIAPRSINIAGSINCVCFDKTGTLTEDGLDMWGVLPKSPTNQFQIPLKDVQRLPEDHFLYGMVSCHSITIMNGELKGDPLDLKMFESTGWILEEANIAENNKYDLLTPTVLKPPKLGKSDSDRSLNLNDSVDQILISNDIGVVREFSFASNLQRMSVITRRIGDDHFNVYCKGSPEMIQTLCRPESIPLDYLNHLNHYAQQGYRIIAIAYKPLDRKITYTKVHRIARDKVESDLEFQGFVILENRLKPDTTNVIATLTAANIRTVMITGDNILTAISVAKDCGIVTKKQSIITVNARSHPSKANDYEIYYTLSAANPSISSPNYGTNGDVYSLMTNSNSIASLETTDTWTHRDCVVTLTQDEIPYLNNYRFAIAGKTWSVLCDHFPELVSKIVTRGTIFARMSPDQKQELIQEYQTLGYYVAMCGDGANDCGALKAAHTGISLSEAESSVASPFTSRNHTIACVPTVIKEGRAALVTCFGIFKYMAAYSLVQFISVLMLYSIDSNLTDIQFLYIDLCLISVFAFFFGRTGAYDGPLVAETPLNSLVSVSPIASLLLHILVSMAFQVASWYHVQQQPWFVPFNFSAAADEKLGCHENYTIFIVSGFQYIILAFIFSKGKPYRKSILSNYWFISAILINLAIVIYMAMIPPAFLANFMELILPPGDYWFRFYLILYGVLNFVISLIIEEVIVEYLLFKKMRYRFHNVAKSQKKYLAIERELNNQYSWPPLSNYQDEANTMNMTEDCSPVSYAEIGAEEHNAENLESERENSILNRFFDPKLQTSNADEHSLSAIESDSDMEQYEETHPPKELTVELPLKTSTIPSSIEASMHNRREPEPELQVEFASPVHSGLPTSHPFISNASSVDHACVNGTTRQSTPMKKPSTLKLKEFTFIDDNSTDQKSATSTSIQMENCIKNPENSMENRYIGNKSNNSNSSLKRKDQIMMTTTS
ncbi:probable cation-transporting ATPase 13A3 isoform X2 [Hermetia illucens]|uniref:probable cation-transporting ATPase 13A3 isoform X2 n=1 Tax=Hermetia illucens TaxID=343691 RepID=UPI0018CC2364|nr:probable cation-transporting ATPase 13A3 isoform X2 [Hermetia illucens]